MEKVLQVAPLNSPVLLLGETGVGKEVIANTIHTKRALKITNGKIEGPDSASERLGINPSTLRGRMEKLSISYKKRKQGKKHTE